MPSRMSSTSSGGLFDVVVSGGGLAGLATALALAHVGLEVAIVDAETVDVRTAPQADGRCSAIAYANFRMLDRLGAGEALSAVAQRIDEIVVSDGRVGDGVRPGGPGPYWLRFLAGELADRTDGLPLGWMVENRQMRLALLGAIAARGEQITHLSPATTRTVEVFPDRAEVLLADGRRLTGRLVIGAEGMRSAVREAAGLRVHGWAYGQHGLVCTVRHARPHGGVAHEYFLPSGPFAILPLRDDRANLVWTERTTVAEALGALPDAIYLDEIRRRFGTFLGEVVLDGPRFSYPLRLQVAEAFVAPRLALVGDAARRVHPIAGQGFNLGLKDAAALADVLGEARAVGLDLGGLDTLERYQAWRRFDSLAMAAATDMFVRLFGTDASPVRLARGLGMAMVNGVPPARRMFARLAGADAGELPSLLRA